MNGCEAMEFDETDPNVVSPSAGYYSRLRHWYENRDHRDPREPEQRLHVGRSDISTFEQRVAYIADHAIEE